MVSQMGIEDVDLEDETVKRLKVQRKKAAFANLKEKVEAFERAIREGRVVKTSMVLASGEAQTRFRQWDEVAAAYRSLRALYVERRDRRGRGWAKPGVN